MPLLPHLLITDLLPSAPGALRQHIPWMLRPWVIDTKDRKDFVRLNYIGVGRINAALIARSVSSVLLPQKREKYEGERFDQALFNLGIAGKYCKGSN